MSLHLVEIIAIVKREGIPTNILDLRDRAYSIPSLSWVNGAFAREQFKRRRKYVDEAWDCEDFTDEAACIARRLHADNPARKAKAGLAFGSVIYQPDQRGKDEMHAINWFVYGSVGQERIGWFEPQKSQSIKLSKNEILSIVDMRL